MAKPKSRIPLSRDKNFPIFESGYTHGRTEMKAEVLTYLQHKYIDSEEVKTDPSMQAILKLAAELSEHVKVLPEKKKLGE